TTSATWGRGKRFERPIAFQGGVAANKGVVRAFEELLGLRVGELIVPRYFDVMGAIGSAVEAIERNGGVPFDLRKGAGDLRRYVEAKDSRASSALMAGLTNRTAGTDGNGHTEVLIGRPRGDRKTDAYLGIDVGASSVNVVALDGQGQLLARRYLLKEGDPIESVRRALEDVGGEIGDCVTVRAVGVTGSGRYFVGDFVGADLVVNEITAQARATLHIDKTVDTIIEIGGQDSKYISLRNGAVVDFEMNKVCAAGTGSFLQEQADRLGVKVEEEFSRLAFSSKMPADLGTRCTVFMESDLIHHQQVGAPKEDLLAGLAYSIANNYIEKVVGNKKIGRNIYFQGGVAANSSVVAAFENILSRRVIVPENHDVTGAIGVALIALGGAQARPARSNFAGFNLRDRQYGVESIRCRHCANACEVKKITVAGKLRSFHGGICDRYDSLGEREAELPLRSAASGVPDLFKEREDMLMRYWREDRLDANAPSIGIPRILMFFEQFPLWAAFFDKIGVRVVLSDKTNSELIHRGLQEVLAETCYPVKVAYGHVMNLIDKGVSCLFLPSVIDLEKQGGDAKRSYNCPYIQAIPFVLGAAFETRIRIVNPVLFMADEKRNLETQMARIGQEFGREKRDIAIAISAGLQAQQEFDQARLRRGREVLDTLGGTKDAVVVIGKPYNVHDVGLNLNVSKKLRKLDVTAIPYDLLPLDAVELPSCYSNLVWKNEQSLLRAAIFCKGNGSLNPIMITNYGCGPDAFFAKYLEDTMGRNPYLTVEVDEHSGDAGMVTRLEAFLDTRDSPKEETSAVLRRDDLCVVGCRGVTSILKPSHKIKELERTLYIFNGSGHSLVWGAAFRSVGLDARVLPMPDKVSEELGRRHVSAKECHPYLVTTGDLVKKVQSADFDPDRSAFVMLNFDGSCRLSQYGLSQKLVLKRLGLEHVPIIAPITSIRHDEATRMFGIKWAIAVWQGWLAVDVLLKKLLHVRPYEVNKGQADLVYDKAIEAISSAIVSGGFRRALETAIAAMNAIAVKRDNRPIVGIVGEFYSCMNPWANRDIIRTLESMGLEVRYGPSTTDYLVYFNEAYPSGHLSRGERSASIYYWVRRWWFMRLKDKIEHMLGDDIYGA
ncbi:MAG: acyl-CoA dehydratase activase-related protein, partial [Chloroflexi bacterium]|nr:acyl-CoA dehydratase activase-related protein [Chloroflexota bacterium]